MKRFLGTKLDISTAYHTQMDGQSEATIPKLEDMIHGWEIDFSNSGDTHSPLVEYSYNNGYHTTIKAAPFETLYKRRYHYSICWPKVGDT